MVMELVILCTICADSKAHWGLHYAFGVLIMIKDARYWDPE